MQSFIHKGIKIAFLDEGKGDAVLLIHGFASNKEVNWVVPGWFSTLAGAGRGVIALDNRGHGQSTKLYKPAEYHSSRMAGDVVALMDHLGLKRADVFGYSMGARIAAFLALEHPARVRSVVLGGLGSNLVTGAGFHPGIAEALEAPSLEDVSDIVGYLFRSFAEQTLSDLRALAACMRGSRQTLAPEELAKIRVPVLVAVGSNDPIAGSARGLAELIPGASALDIPGRDHMLAVGDRLFMQSVLDFLDRRP
ncbi:MAG: alpha/beta fold hydrolase [Xanthobacteraceae bacterium]|nr:alpha/beta fold hydrolase [Xanthobacteraceae bacterium]